MDQFLKSVVDVIDLIGPEWRPFIVLLLMYVGWRVAKQKNWVNGEHALTQEEIQNSLTPVLARIAAVEAELQGDIEATRDLAASVRDTTEQLNRNVNTSVVVLTKIDSLRDVLIGLDAKIGTMGK